MAKYINLEIVNTLLDNISIAGVDGILTFNDGVEFVKDVINDMPPNGTIDIIRCNNCEDFYCCDWSINNGFCDRGKRSEKK